MGWSGRHSRTRVLSGQCSGYDARGTPKDGFLEERGQDSRDEEWEVGFWGVGFLVPLCALLLR